MGSCRAQCHQSTTSLRPRIIGRYQQLCSRLSGRGSHWIFVKFVMIFQFSKWLVAWAMKGTSQPPKALPQILSHSSSIRICYSLLEGAFDHYREALWAPQCLFLNWKCRKTRNSRSTSALPQAKLFPTGYTSALIWLEEQQTKHLWAIWSLKRVRNPPRLGKSCNRRDPEKTRETPEDMCTNSWQAVVLGLCTRVTHTACSGSIHYLWLLLLCNGSEIVAKEMHG
jgi:hypothetical protein